MDGAALHPLGMLSSGEGPVDPPAGLGSPGRGRLDHWRNPHGTGHCEHRGRPLTPASAGTRLETRTTASSLWTVTCPSWTVSKQQPRSRNTLPCPPDGTGRQPQPYLPSPPTPQTASKRSVPTRAWTDTSPSLSAVNNSKNTSPQSVLHSSENEKRQLMSLK